VVAPDPYAAAAMANGSKAPAAPARKARMPSLFERVTGVARSRPVTEPAAPVAPAATVEPVAAPPITVQPAAPAAPVQPRLGALDPADRLPASKAEEDLLEIPAFLRRQAN